MKTRNNNIHCPSYANEKTTLVDKIRNINTSILEQNDIIITKDLVFGNISLDVTSNILILNATIDYFISLPRGGLGLLQQVRWSAL